MSRLEYLLLHTYPLWGIDGPTWLMLISGLFCVGLLVWWIADARDGYVAARAVRDAAAEMSGGSGEPHGRGWNRDGGRASRIAASMAPAYVAYLCGGPRRVTDLAFAELAVAGAVPVLQASNRKIALASEVKRGAGAWAPGAAGPSHGLSPLAVTLLEASRGRGAINKRARRAVNRDIGAIRAELVDGGLVRRNRIRPHSAIALAAFAVFMLVNIVRTVIAANSYRPYGFMVALLVTMVIVVFCVVMSRRTPKNVDPELTPEGRAVRAVLDGEAARLGDTVAMLPDRAQGLMLVAIGGLAATAMVSPVLAQTYSTMMWTSPFSGGDGGSTYGCGGGGGSCGGGGGCGGCGS
ncbi:TIGR04222 domain-containing membrane protein [Corynebacterium sp. NPDC060344]|uniref:TIGR04222 domain-containing membrane protein n=1 Tax=Corynebacterium sp. NPDC060344 TaxID=3347101 RepID=UPI003649428A